MILPQTTTTTTIITDSTTVHVGTGSEWWLCTAIGLAIASIPPIVLWLAPGRPA